MSDEKITTKVVECAGREWLVASNEGAALYTNGCGRDPDDTVDFVAAVNADPALNQGFKWRLPTLDELKSTIGQENAPIAGWYWSSSPYVGHAYGAWVVTFGDGDVSYDDRDSSNHVRLVRADQ